MRAHRALWLGLLCVTACSPLARRGDEALAGGRYAEAADWYDRAYRDHRDPELLARRDAARQHALAQSESVIAAARDAHNIAAALAALSERTRLRGRWEVANDYDATERRWIIEIMGLELQPLLAHRQALAAEAKLHERAQALQVEHATAPLEAAVRDVGRANCARFDDAVDDESAPYAAQLVARYCAHFGLPRDRTPAPDAVSSVTMRGRVDGFGAEALAALGRALADALATTPFYDAAAARAATVTLTGGNGQRYSQAAVTINQPYIHQEPYQFLESYQQSYWDTEHYMATESYSQSESYSTTENYTTSQSYTYSCGHSSCSGSRPVTHTRTVMRTRMVPRTRMVSRTRQVMRYRSATRWVTRWRAVPSTFTYEAVKHTGDFWCKWSATAQLDGVPLELAIERSEQKTALQHDARLEEAQVEPSAGTLPRPLEWQLEQVQQIAANLASTAQARWRAHSCALPSPTLEEAARCARLDGTEAPGAAKSALATLFGAEVAPLLALK